MSRKVGYLLSVAVGASVVSAGSEASETVTYTYDALGRLVAVSTSGGPNDDVNVSTAYDPAGNRSNYSVTSGAPPPPPAAYPPASCAC